MKGWGLEVVLQKEGGNEPVPDAEYRIPSRQVPAVRHRGECPRGEPPPRVPAAQCGAEAPRGAATGGVVLFVRRPPGRRDGDPPRADRRDGRSNRRGDRPGPPGGGEAAP